MRPEIFDRRACSLGEGPIWDDRTGEAMWVDIFNGRIHAVEIASGSTRTIETGSLVGAVIPRRVEGWFVALEHGPAVLAGDGAIEAELGTWAQADGHAPAVAVRCNDAKCDLQGRCFMGTMAHGADPGCGALYRLVPGRPLEKLVGDITISNGLAWPDDWSRLFYIDTGTQGVDVFDYDLSDGTISNRRRLVDIPADAGSPDGMTVDADGCLWVALWGGGAVRRYTPDGELDRVVEFPTPETTSCAFVGSDLDRMIVTTARLKAAADDPIAGSTYIVDVGVRGTPTLPFGG